MPNFIVIQPSPPTSILHAHQGGDSKVHPELSGEIIQLVWPGNALGFSSTSEQWQVSWCWDLRPKL